MNITAFRKIVTISAIAFLFPLSTILAQDAPIEEYQPADEIDRDDDFNRRINPVVAGWLGYFLPGLGQLLNGNGVDGAAQLSFYLMGSSGSRHYRRRPDYIPDNERVVEFNSRDAMLGYWLRKNGYAYNDSFNRDLLPTFPYFGENNWSRDARLLKNGHLAEENPLIKYGSYERNNQTTMNADMFGQMSLASKLYSSYSAYRDAGGVPDRSDETISDLALAPFQSRYILNGHFAGPIALVLILSALQAKSDMPPVLVDRGAMRQRSAYNLYISFNAAVFEEAFFRGFLNDSISKSWGSTTGSVISSLAFGLAHMKGGNLLSVLPQTLFGFYAAYLQNANNGDFRQAIAIHFWWDIIAIGAILMRYKADRNHDKNQLDVHFMPVSYSFKF